MKRLILSLGLVWALIYTANHTVFVRAPSDTKAKIATSTQQLSTDRRIDSWGAYLPHVRPPLPNDNPAGSPFQPRQPREVAAREMEADPASLVTTTDIPPPPKEEISDIEDKARSERRNAASLESRPMLKKPAAASRRAKSHRAATVRPQLAQASVHQRWGGESTRQRRGVGLFIFAPPGI
jgi:hypothetical protein